MATLRSETTPDAGVTAWNLAPTYERKTDLQSPSAFGSQDQFSFDTRPQTRTLPPTTTQEPAGNAIPVTPVLRSEAHARDPRPEAHVRAVEGVIVRFDEETVLCALTSLRDEIRVALPTAIFPAQIAEGTTFVMEMSLGSDGFRTPVVTMAAIQPSAEVAVIHDRIRALLADF